MTKEFLALAAHSIEAACDYIFNAYVYEAGGDAASSLLDALARSLKLRWDGIPEFDRSSVAPVAHKARFIASHLDTLDNPFVIKAAEAVGLTAEDVRQFEAALKEC